MLYNITSFATSLFAQILDMILNDHKKPVDREKLIEKLSYMLKLQGHALYSINKTRRIFTMYKFQRKHRKSLEETVPGEYLYGGNLKDLIYIITAKEKAGSSLFITNRQKPPSGHTFRNVVNWNNLSKMSHSMSGRINQKGSSHSRKENFKSKKYFQTN